MPSVEEVVDGPATCQSMERFISDFVRVDEVPVCAVFSYTMSPETFIGAVAFHEVFTSDVNLCYVL